VNHISNFIWLYGLLVVFIHSLLHLPQYISLESCAFICPIASIDIPVFSDFYLITFTGAMYTFVYFDLRAGLPVIPKPRHIMSNLPLQNICFQSLEPLHRFLQFIAVGHVAENPI